METVHTAMQRFEIEAHNNAQLNALTDEQLAELLLNEVWADMSSLTTAATLVGQAIDRLKRSSAGPLTASLGCEACSRYPDAHPGKPSACCASCGRMVEDAGQFSTPDRWPW